MVICCFFSQQTDESATTKTINEGQKDKMSFVEKTTLEKEAIVSFLDDDITLEAFYRAFDSNKNNEMDYKEFENLVYKCLLHFIKLRNPDLPPPMWKEMKHLVKSVAKRTFAYIDTNRDRIISEEEFRRYGDYLKNEFAKLLNDLAAEKKIENKLVSTEEDEKTKLLHPEGNVPERDPSFDLL